MPQGARTVSRDVCTLSNSLQTFTLQHLKKYYMWTCNFGNWTFCLRIYAAAMWEMMFSCLMAGRPKSDLVKPLYTGPHACWVWLFSLVISLPLTGSEWVSRHFRFRFDGSSGGLPIYFQTQFGIAAWDNSSGLQTGTSSISCSMYFYTRAFVPQWWYRRVNANTLIGTVITCSKWKTWKWRKSCRIVHLLLSSASSYSSSPSSFFR